MNKETRKWVRKAEADIVGARELKDERSPLISDLICFHCQQMAEKYLMALLQELGLVVPRTHELDKLLALLMPHHPSLGSFQRTFMSLSRFAVEYRYPDENATRREATTALRQAERIRLSARVLLGIKS